MAVSLAERINRFIARTHPNSPLAGKGEMLVRVGQRYGVDPRVLAIIARKESQFGLKSGKYKHNAWGWGVHLGPSVYTSRSWEEGASKVARGLASSLYKGAGLTTLAKIIQKYAPPSENDTQRYIREIQGWYREMGGNPNANVFNPQSWGAAGGSANPAANRVGVARAARGAQEQYQLATEIVPGRIDGQRLFSLLNAQRERALQGLMPAPGFMTELAKLAQGALPRAQASLRRTQPEPGPVDARQPRFTLGGTDRDHGNRALGNWQSDNAYDLMGKAGDAVYSPVQGVVTKISGKPGGSPQFAGYGITVKTAQGELFFKHLGTKNVKVGDRISVGTLLGTLDGSTQGGPHLHLGATHDRLLKSVADFYLKASGGRQPAAARRANRRGGAVVVRPYGGWGGSEGPARDMAKIAARHGLKISSSKRDRRGTASGGVSDHWSGKRNAYAVDLAWGGSRPTAASDRAASEIVAALGGPANWGRRGGVFNTTINGLRFQVIYRSDVGGNHWNHIHVGVQRV